MEETAKAFLRLMVPYSRLPSLVTAAPPMSMEAGASHWLSSVASLEFRAADSVTALKVEPGA